MAPIDPTRRESFWWRLLFFVSAMILAFLKVALFPSEIIYDILLTGFLGITGQWLGGVVAEHRALARWHRQRAVKRP
ncbi:MAG TPA: hypothetical protein VGH74_05260, partial [Planctomycetaceae bacterium]